MQSRQMSPGIDDNGTNEQQQKHQPQQLQHSQKLLQQQAPVGMVSPPGEFVMPHTQVEQSMGGETLRQAPTVYPFFGSVVTAYGPQAMVHPYMLGLQQAGLPLPSDTIEEPVYVNAKQYHGILRRRQIRAKAESENKLIKSRKPYLHESRHLHALKRARGCGGRFLNTKKDGKSRDGMLGDKSLEKDVEAGKANSGKEGSSQVNVNAEKRQRINDVGQLDNTEGTHAGTVSSGMSNALCQSYHRSQPSHSSAFHLFSVGSSESGQVGSMVSKGSHHTAVATQ
uniref:Nuclear transcription factor Y subunit n=1 Tax=Wollemia nobilis TaxID=56998 RepID=A0A0C9S869_9CONI